MQTTHTQRAAYDVLDGGMRRTQKQMIPDMLHIPFLKLAVRNEPKCADTGFFNETLGLPATN
ncbi:hypothetical protein [Paraburkholderia sp. J12]|uniref:hypothetical protein n=1 Tax=Paraburkholderia sp. J12 TaxID=2805432 RepID=UPI002ABE7197|nr:hypothetical protein [Paraburkholderia sp. J12]